MLHFLQMMMMLMSSEIENINLYPNAVVSIYNRHGNEVFERKLY